jgi:DNA-binding GntR family transcriptional regulator
MNTARTTAAHAERYAEPSTAGGPARDDSAPSTTAVGHAYTSIKDSLLLGAYPLGARLAEERLARDVGVSRTPVREALLRLHAEDLVCRHPGGGYAPTVPNIAEVRELYEVRVALERSGILRPRTSGLPHDAAVLRAMLTQWTAIAAESSVPSPEFVVVDEAFHVGLAEASGNREMAALLHRVNERIRVVRMRDFPTMDRITRTVSEHATSTSRCTGASSSAWPGSRATVRRSSSKPCWGCDRSRPARCASPARS